MPLSLRSSASAAFDVGGPEPVRKSRVPAASAYKEIEANELRPCHIDSGRGPLFFCLEPKAGLSEDIADCAASLTGNCKTCVHRIRKFSQMIGRDGEHVAFSQDVSDPMLEKIRCLRERVAASRSVSDYQLVIVDREFMGNYPVEVGPFSHVHFTCEQLTPDNVVAEVKGLSSYLNGSFDSRFERLVDNLRSLKVIQGEIPKLARPDHWKPVADWAVALASRARGRRWAELAAHEKFEVMLCAMLSGRSAGGIHFDMQQASNLVDFIEDGQSLSALRAMMDERSDPETYQVSRVASLLRKKCVASSCTVTLSWGLDGQPFRSDLDLHTSVDGQELYYASRVAGSCQLDFDANACQVERNPAENISLNQVGTFVLRVNNYNNRDFADVPFEVTVRKPGFSEVHSGIWPRSRVSGDFIIVCAVTVTAEDLEEKPPELSDAERRKLSAKEAEWERFFGDVSSTVASSEDLQVCEVRQGAALGQRAGSQGAHAAFAALLAGGPQAARQTLAERCRLETLSGLIELSTRSGCSLEVDPRNFAPAYITRLETHSDVLSTKFSINTYHRKYEPPQQPRSDEPPTARFDDAWGVSRRVAVHGFVSVGGTWFMVLAGARLPTCHSWPLGAGMFPGSLKPEVHHHRSKWVSYHCMVAPGLPQCGIPLIGSVLVGFDSLQFILNGCELLVRCV